MNTKSPDTKSPMTLMMNGIRRIGQNPGKIIRLGQLQPLPGAVLILGVRTAAAGEHKHRVKFVVPAPHGGFLGL